MGILSKSEMYDSSGTMFERGEVIGYYSKVVVLCEMVYHLNTWSCITSLGKLKIVYYKP